MLSLFAKHGLFDLDVKAKGDLDVDLHHTNEDIGLVLGEAFKKALGSGEKIKRFGYFCVPMDESLVRVTVDISGRPGFYISGSDEIFSLSGENYNFDYTKHFLSSFLNKLQANVHIEIIRGENFHHVIEALFKCLGKVLDYATLKDDRIQGIPSTKGIL
jgi:imidazoleglycerol-phosphate dehydratase